MGGALALVLHRKKPGYWDGAVLVAPMCKVGPWRLSSFFHIFTSFIFFLDGRMRSMFKLQK